MAAVFASFLLHVSLTQAEVNLQALQAHNASNRKNIVFVLTDDQGWQTLWIQLKRTHIIFNRCCLPLLRKRATTETLHL